MHPSRFAEVMITRPWLYQYFCFRKRTWDVCAREVVQDIVQICEGDGKLVISHTLPASRIGRLLMLKPSSSTVPGPRRFYLNKFLVKKGFAEHSSEEVEKDLKKVDPGLAFGL